MNEKSVSQYGMCGIKKRQSMTYHGFTHHCINSMYQCYDRVGRIIEIEYGGICIGARRVKLIAIFLRGTRRDKERIRKCQG